MLVGSPVIYPRVCVEVGSIKHASQGSQPLCLFPKVVYYLALEKKMSYVFLRVSTHNACRRQSHTQVSKSMVSFGPFNCYHYILFYLLVKVLFLLILIFILLIYFLFN